MKRINCRTALLKDLLDYKQAAHGYNGCDLSNVHNIQINNRVLKDVK
jgi:hypothetical protein